MAEVFEQKLLIGKNAIVTGGGSGINLAIARRFATHGASVALIGRTKEKLDSAADEAAKKKLMERMNEVLNRRSYIRNLVNGVRQELAGT